MPREDAVGDGERDVEVRGGPGRERALVERGEIEVGALGDGVALREIDRIESLRPDDAVERETVSEERVRGARDVVVRERERPTTGDDPRRRSRNDGRTEVVRKRGHGVDVLVSFRHLDADVGIGRREIGRSVERVTAFDRRRMAPHRREGSLGARRLHRRAERRDGAHQVTRRVGDRHRSGGMLVERSDADPNGRRSTEVDDGPVARRIHREWRVLDADVELEPNGGDVDLVRAGASIVPFAGGDVESHPVALVNEDAGEGRKDEFVGGDVDGARQGDAERVRVGGFDRRGVETDLVRHGLDVVVDPEAAVDALELDVHHRRPPRRSERSRDAGARRVRARPTGVTLTGEVTTPTDSNVTEGPAVGTRENRFCGGTLIERTCTSNSTIRRRS